MKKFSFLIFLIFTSLFLFVEIKANVPYTTINVSITSIFNEENNQIEMLLEDQIYGSKITVDSIFNNIEGNTFAFWVVNGAIRYDLPLNHEFLVTSKLTLQAVFSPDDKHVVLFMDSNGLLLDVKFVANGATVTFTGTIPSKPGMVVSSNMWSGSLTNVTNDKVLVLQYELLVDQVYEINVINGSGSGEYQFNSFVTATANPAAEGQYFNYWLVNGDIVSYDEQLIFSALENSAVEAVFSNSPIFKKPIVTMSGNLNLPDREGYMSFKGKFYIPEHYELVEYGMIASDVYTDMVLGNPLVEVKQGLQHTESSNEWLMSFSELSYSYVRAYLVVRNTQNELLVVYSEEQEIEELVLYQDLTNLNNVAPAGWVFSGTGAMYADKSSRLDSTGDYIQTSAFELLKPAIFTVTIKGNSLSGDGGTLTFTDQLGNVIHTETNILNNSIHTISFTITDLDVTKVRMTFTKTTGNIGVYDVSIKHIIEESVFDGYLLQLISDENVDISVSVVGPFYQPNTQLTVTAGNHATLSFSHWEDYVTGNTISYSPNYSFYINNDTFLKAVYVDGSGQQLDVIYDANINNQYVSISNEGPYEYNDEVTLTADSVIGYEFLYWKDLKTEHVFSYEQVTTFYVNDVHQLRAIYQEEGTLFYSTGFEDASKSTYALGDFTTSSRTWFSYQSFVETSTVINGTRSFKLDNGGFISTKFSVNNPSKVSFFFETFGTEAASTLRMQFSTNGLSWHNLVDLDTPLSGSAYFEYDMDLLTLWMNYNIDENTDFYFRFVNLGVGTQTNAKINIDDIKIYTYNNFVGYPLYNHESNILTFTLDQELSDVYQLGDTWNPNICTATDAIAGEVSCAINGSVDTNVRGSYLITYTATDSNGTAAEYRKEIAVLKDKSLLDLTLNDYNGYYSSVSGLYGEELMLALREILWINISMPSYTEIKSILEVTDRDPNNSSNVIHIYTGQSVVGAWDPAREWDREHIWPNSRLGILRVSETGRNAASDAHNLRPINASINSSRGNLFFDYENGTYWYPDYNRVDSRSDVGDVARSTFYMSVMYDWLNLTDDLTQMINSDTYHFDHTDLGLLSAFIEFHYQDLPDSFEINRNNVIYSYQNNRNPFVDYPHFVELIWFDHDKIPEA